jgi:hypothetical protein
LTQFQYPSGVHGVPGVIKPRAGLVGAGGMIVVVVRVVDFRVVFLVVLGVGTVINTPPGALVVLVGALVMLVCLGGTAAPEPAGH